MTYAYGLRTAAGAVLTAALALAAPAQAAGTDPWVRSWGINTVGQLGNGSLVNQQTPGSMRDLARDEVRQLSAGGYSDATGFVAALLKDGTVRSWGNNTMGQLGNGTTVNQSTPATVAGLSGVSRIASGTTHVLALRAGRLLAWGGNAYGELGNGTIVPTKDGTQNLPLPVQSIDEVKDVSVGCAFSVALRQDGSVWTWGTNSYGRLGLGDTNNRPTPQQVTGLSDIVAISAGCQHVLALTAEGTVKAWGRGQDGRLGTDSTDDSPLPADVAHLDGVARIYAGARHNFAVLEDGEVRAWGANASGQLGDGTTTDRTTPVPIDALRDIQDLDPGANHTLAVRTDQSVLAWGDNAAGQLGDGTTKPVLVPVRVLPAGSGITHVDAATNANSSYAY
ncbi:chromosome condensation regulator RCC1 [Streptomyces sp. NBC_00234]|uniref:RCC1 domain-containing protein n=1 Tax=Streptomyces sp. NBC_00234 TaxID=2903638 RepID=UPI002E2A71F3|nr:chromosome condensation regulator RCC1 [Streptomyces sp. NBC_00234]